MHWYALAELMDGPDEFGADPPRSPHVSYAQSGRVRSLYGLDDLDTLIVSGGLGTAALTVANFSRRAPEAQYTMRRHNVEPAVADLCDPLAIAQFLQEGYSLHVSNLQRYSADVSAFSDRLAFELGCPVKAEAFMTPPGAQAFAEHYDTNDNFICQTAGRKTWRLYSPPYTSPLVRHPWSWTDVSDDLRTRIVDEPPDLEVTLEPGAVLWIPRGWIHAGTAASETSMHVTLRPEPVSFEWVSKQMIEYRADEDRRLRRSVAYGSFTTPETIQALLRDTAPLLQAMLSEATDESAAVQLLNAHAALHAGPIMRPVNAIAVEDDPAGHDDLWFRPEGAVGYRRRDGELHVNLGTARKILDGVAAGLIEGILVNGKYVSVNDLGARFSSVMEWGKFISEMRAVGLVAHRRDLIGRWLAPADG